jgi:UDP-N-acetylmuramoylalanine-D-glutamate ligase
MYNILMIQKRLNVNAHFFALDSMNMPTVWIVGGVDKGTITMN